MIDESGNGPLFDRRKVIMGLAMGAAAGVTYARQPTERLDRLGSAKLDKLVPTKIGQWEFLTTSGLVVPTEDALSDALYSQLLTRVYVGPDGPPIMLLIAQSAGQTGLLQLHRPEFCYPAGGFTLTPIVQQPLRNAGADMQVNVLTAAQPGRTERIIYWTRVGDAMPVSWAAQRLSIASDNLRGVVPDAVLVRVSTIDPDERSAFRQLSAFVEAMLVGMGPSRKVLVADV